MRPTTTEEASGLLREIHADGGTVRIRGGGTKDSWPGSQSGSIELSTGGLNRTVEHNPGDLTAVLEPGVELRDAESRFAIADQMLAMDPPRGDSGGATIGGVVATSDSGPLRHRYGSVRDQVIGVTVVLSDGTVSKSGGKVIKNVAGYDVAKLFAGAHGSLGLIASITVRLHPRSPGSATAIGEADDPAQLAAAATAIAALPLEAVRLDVSWEHGNGSLLVQLAGAAAAERAEATCAELRRYALHAVRAVEDDRVLWARQRQLQRRDGGLVVKISGRPSDLPRVLALAEERGGNAVARAALGVSYVTFPADDGLNATIRAVRAALGQRRCTILDGSGLTSEAAWPSTDPGAAAVMRRIKDRLDPAGVFGPIPIEGGG